MQEYKDDLVRLINCRCEKFMEKIPNKFYDLAIIDPPYGVEKGNMAPSRIQKYGQMKTANDDKPNKEYFEELFRISKNQIIWGYNHLSDMLPPTKEFIFWFKHQPVDTYSDGELAWTSFNKTAKCFDFPYFGFHGKDIQRIHPNQKPVVLYKWLLKKYASDGYKILDTHGGSMSIAIACFDLKYNLTLCEKDEKYFNDGLKRYKSHIRLKRLW